jgi:protein-tyrosine phosphatase
MPHSTVLFLCSGNYYRSRFAEILFNELATACGLAWRATSRGLSNEVGPWKVGPISPFALAGLEARGIDTDEQHREPIHCGADDLESATMIIALKELEHRPLMEKRFPGWVDRVEYWHIHDIDVAPPEVGLAELEQHVGHLVARLKAQAAANSSLVR